MGNVEKSKDNLSKCMCMKCPSYTFACKAKAMPSNMMHMMKGDITEAEHMEGLFCAFGKSKCITEKQGCVCGDCKVYIENDLSDSYYCLEMNGK